MRKQWDAVAATAVTAPPSFDPASLGALPTPVQRWLTHSIKPATPLWSVADIRMHGEIQVSDTWAPFDARQILAPGRGFVWAASTRVRGLPVSGFDRYVAGAGRMRWRILSLIPVISAGGDDVTMSARGRLAGEGALVPTAYRDATWRDGTEGDTAVAAWWIDGQLEEAHLSIDGSGRLVAIRMDRWGNPGGGSYARVPFGVHVEREHCFDGVMMPSRFRAAWWAGSPREAEGEFFRATIDAVAFR